MAENKPEDKKEDGKEERNLAQEIGEDIFNSIETPVEILFFTLFVFGVLTISSSLLIGPCGNIQDDDFENLRNERIVVGGTVVTDVDIVLGNTIINSGVCGIVEEINEEDQEVKIHILAKATPSYVNEGEYTPLKAFSGFTEVPLTTLLYLHRSTPSGVVNISDVVTVETRPFSNFWRTFYLERIWTVILILLLFIILFTYIGVNYHKKRKVFYHRHTQRAIFKSRLAKDKGKVKQLRKHFDSAVELSVSQSKDDLHECLDSLQHVLKEILILTEFKGETTTEKLENITEKDLWTIERLWKAYSVIIRIELQTRAKVDGDAKLTEEEKILIGMETPDITPETIKILLDIYKESFIALGLLHYSDYPDKS